MAKIAVIKTGGKQYMVRKGDIFKVEKLKAKKGELVEFDVLMVSSDDAKDIKIGQPVLKDEKIKAKVLEEGRSKKVRVVHYKPKTRYHKVYGHRQPYTKLQLV